jgi:hypothetical protein
MRSVSYSVAIRLFLVICAAGLLGARAGFAGEAPADARAGAEPPRRGAYEARFKESSPLSPLSVLEGRTAVTRSRCGEYDLSKESFAVFVPDEYDGKKPYGLIVFINAGDSGDCPQSFHPVLSRHGCIWIGANKSGNGRQPPNARLGLALDAVHNMTKTYRDRKSVV